MMKKYLQAYGYAFYLGCALTGFADLDYSNWQFWAIIVPLIILVIWSQEGGD